MLYPVELWNLYLMRREGLEPSRTEVHTGLNRVRLPISPSALAVVYSLHAVKDLSTLPYRKGLLMKAKLESN